MLDPAQYILFPVGSNIVCWLRDTWIFCSFLLKCCNSLACALKSEQDNEGLESMFCVPKGDEMSNLKSRYSGETILGSSNTEQY